MDRIEVNLAVLRCLARRLERFSMLPCGMDRLGMRRSLGDDPRDVVTHLVRTYLKQLLEDGFFHADPHPGNLRVMPDGRLAFFDFGMVGRLPQALQTALLEAFGHLITRDVPGLIDDMQHLGVLTIPSQAAPDVTPMIAAIVARYVGRPLGEVSVHTLLLELAPMLVGSPVRIPAPLHVHSARADRVWKGSGRRLTRTSSSSRWRDPMRCATPSGAKAATAVACASLGYWRVRRGPSIGKGWGSSLSSLSHLCHV